MMGTFDVFSAILFILDGTLVTIDILSRHTFTSFFQLYIVGKSRLTPIFFHKMATPIVPRNSLSSCTDDDERTMGSLYSCPVAINIKIRRGSQRSNCRGLRSAHNSEDSSSRDSFFFFFFLR